MRLTRKVVLAGLASLAMTGAAAAGTPEPRLNRMDLAMPDGSVARILYRGDVPPRVVIAAVPAPRPIGPAWRLERPGSGPFAMLDRIAAQMRLRAAEMIRRLAVMDRAFAGPRLASAQGLPPGTTGYRLLAQAAGNGICTRSITVVREGAGQKPKVFTETSGDCPAPAPPGARPQAKRSDATADREADPDIPLPI